MVCPMAAKEKALSSLGCTLSWNPIEGLLDPYMLWSLERHLLHSQEDQEDDGSFPQWPLIPCVPLLGLGAESAMPHQVPWPFTDLFLAVQGLHCCAGFSLVAMQGTTLCLQHVGFSLQ